MKLLQKIRCNLEYLHLWSNPEWIPFVHFFEFLFPSSHTLQSSFTTKIQFWFWFSSLCSMFSFFQEFFISLTSVWTDMEIGRILLSLFQRIDSLFFLPLQKKYAFWALFYLKFQQQKNGKRNITCTVIYRSVFFFFFLSWRHLNKLYIFIHSLFLLFFFFTKWMRNKGTTSNLKLFLQNTKKKIKRE